MNFVLRSSVRKRHHRPSVDSLQPNWMKTYRHTSILGTRLLANMGIASQTLLLARFHSPPDPEGKGKRWLDGLYLDQPQE